jgi:hypothetical protein
MSKSKVLYLAALEIPHIYIFATRGYTHASCFERTCPASTAITSACSLYTKHGRIGYSSHRSGIVGACDARLSAPAGGLQVTDKTFKNLQLCFMVLIIIFLQHHGVLRRCSSCACDWAAWSGAVRNSACCCIVINSRSSKVVPSYPRFCRDHVITTISNFGCG